MTDATACNDAWRKRISAYHDGGVLGEERTAVEAHLQSCVTCQQIIAGYDQLYRDLRTMPGFEGLLTITKPGSRRGVGSTARPALTWPGKSLPDPNGAMRRSAGGGTLLLTLLVLMGLIFLVGRDTGVIGPSSNANLTGPQQGVAPTAYPSPTFAARTPGGTLCANMNANTLMTYSYADNHSNLWRVTDCDDPAQLRTLALTDFTLGAWSPDNSQQIIFSPALAHRSATTRIQVAIMSIYKTSLQPIALTPTGITTPLSAQEAVWTGDATLLVLAQSRVVQVNLTTNTETWLGMTATHIAWRANALFYSTVAQGHATLHRYDPATKADTSLLSLGAGQTTCATSACWNTIPWDVSSDGLSVVYQYPPPTTLPTSISGNAAATLVLEDLRTGDRTTLATLPITGTPLAIQIAPDGHRVAAYATNPGTTPLLVVSSDGKTSLTFAVQGQIAWRPDGQALIVSPLAPSSTSAPMLINVDTDQTSSLPTLTADYLWQG
jgi:hypothetical protein